MIRPPVGRPRALGISSSVSMRPHSEMKKRRSSEGSNSAASDGYASSTASGRRALTPVPRPILSSPRVRAMTGIVSPRGEFSRRPKSASEEPSRGKGKGRSRSTPKCDPPSRVQTISSRVESNPPARGCTKQRERSSSRDPADRMRPFYMRLGSQARMEATTDSRRSGEVVSGGVTRGATNMRRVNKRVVERVSTTSCAQQNAGVIEKGVDGDTKASPSSDLALGELSPVVGEESRWQKQVDSLTAALGEKDERIESLQRQLKDQEETDKARWEEIAALRAEVESSKSALRKVTSSLKNQVRAREGRLQSLMEELEGKKGEIVDLNTQLEEAKQQVVLQQERQNQFVTTERAKADRMAEKLERSEAERRAEVNELNLYYQQALHDLRTQNAAHEATIKQLDESLCDIKRLLSTRGRDNSFDSPVGVVGQGESIVEDEELEDHKPDESPADRQRRSSVKDRVRELEALSGGRPSGSSNHSAPSSSATVPGTSTPIPTALGGGVGLSGSPPSSVGGEASIGAVLLDQAHECFTEALDLCSEDKFTLAMTVLDQALGYLSNGANTSLQEYFRTDDDAKTLLSDIYGQQGVCQQSLGNIDRAIHCYSRAVEVDADAHACHANLAVLLLSMVSPQGNDDSLLKRAKEHLNRAVELDPSNSEYEDIWTTVDHMTIHMGKV